MSRPLSRWSCGLPNHFGQSCSSSKILLQRDRGHYGCALVKGPLHTLWRPSPAWTPGPQGLLTVWKSLRLTNPKGLRIRTGLVQGSKRARPSPNSRGASRCCGRGRLAPGPLSLSPSYPALQLDADDAKPTFDEEEGQDEYDEVAMPV